MPLEKAARHRPGAALYRAMTHEIAAQTAAVIAILTVALLANDLVGYSDLVINRDLGLAEVSRIAGFQIVSIVSTMLPFAFLIGALGALGRLAGDRALLALEANGISVQALLGPLLAVSLLVTAAALPLATFAAPWSNRAIDDRLAELALTSPSALVQPGQTGHFGSWQIETDSVSADGRTLQGVRMFVPELGETVFARSGLLDTNRRNRNRITLEDGVVLLEPRDGPRRLRFARLSVDLPRGGHAAKRSRKERVRGLTFAELEHRIRPDGVEAFHPRTAHLAESEIHRRFAWPVATLMFGLLVLPLLLLRGRFSRANGLVVGAGLTLAYYGLVQLGDGLANGNLVGVPLGTWLPNLALAIVAAPLLWRASHGSGVRLLAIPESGHRLRDAAARLLRRVSRADAPTTPERRASRLRTGALPLDRYVAIEFLHMSAVCTAVVVSAYLIIDVLDKVDWMSRYGATGRQLLSFYAARAPLLVSRALPFALLIATMLTVSRFSIDGELVGMRASGFSLRRAFLPVVLICGVLTPLYFGLVDVVVPEAQQVSRHIRDVTIKGKPGDAVPRRDVWYRGGDRVYELRSFDERSGSALGVTILEIGADGAPTARSDAESASHQGDGVWRLASPTRYAIAGDSLRMTEAEPFTEIGIGLVPGVTTRQISSGELDAKIAELQAAGYAATALRVDYWARHAAPFACLLLPLFGLLFAISGPPFPTPAMNVVVAIASAVAYLLITGIANSLGRGGALPPIVAAFLPLAIFAVAAAVFARREMR